MVDSNKLYNDVHLIDHASNAFIGTDSNGKIIPGVTSGFATTELDNLGTTAVNADILPDTYNTHDLGGVGYAWAEVHANKVFNVNRASGGTFTITPNAGFIFGAGNGNVTVGQSGCFSRGFCFL